MPKVTSSCPKGCIGVQLLDFVGRCWGRGDGRCKCMEGELENPLSPALGSWG